MRAARRGVSAFHELRRRKIWRVAAVYVVVGAGVIGFAEAALPPRLWDDIRIPVVTIAALGLFIALALAWSYDLTWGGTHRGPESATGQVPDEVSSEKPDPGLQAVSAETSDRSVVVLPFENLSPDPDQDYFCDGMTEEIITDLSRLRSLRVISRTSAMLLKGSGKDVRTIGRDVGVRYVLEGSVRRSGNRLRVTAQLIDSRNDAHLWAERYDGEVGDVFAIQESVARSIAEALRVELTPEEERKLGPVPVRDTYAWECVLRARHEIWRGTESSVRKAIEYLRSAQEVVGENVAVLGALGEAEFILPHITGTGVDSISERLDHIARRILRLDPDAAVGQFNLGIALLKQPWRFPEGIREFRLATALDPADTSILLFNAFFIAEAGCTDEGMSASDRLLVVDPLSPITRLNRSFVLTLSGSAEQGLPEAEAALRMDPENAYFGFFLMLVLAQLGRREEVERLAISFASLPADNWAKAVLLYGAALNGKPIDALLDPHLLRTARFDETFSWIMAQCMAQVGRIDEALDWLENAASLGFTNPEFLGERDVLLEPLRGEPRFATLLAKARRVREELRDDTNFRRPALS